MTKDEFEQSIKKMLEEWDEGYEPCVWGISPAWEKLIEWYVKETDR